MIDLNDLNPEQRAAVEYVDGPQLVIAGAGSGKTRVLTYKVAHLIDLGYEPWSILALTFTNKAAREMKERVRALLGDDSAPAVWMGTFHSVFLRILQMECEAVGYQHNFSVYDADDSKSVLRSIVKEMQLNDKIYKPSVLQSRISRAKNQLVTAEDYIASPANYQADVRANIPLLGKIFQAYSERLRRANSMDFDDLLVNTFMLFDTHPEIQAKYAKRFRYVLVDEYQDTNFAQHRIVLQLTSCHHRLCVVGDDAQSIYSFRGAQIENILSFQNAYADSRLFKLEQNYRSTQTIVQAANSLISRNEDRISKTVFSRNAQGETIDVYETYSDVDEAAMVLGKIRALRRSEQLPFSSFAILYRTNAQSRVFEEILRKSGAPYKVYGSLSFYQRKEIKDLVSYFRLVINHDDDEAFRRVINEPKRGIGAVTLQKIAEAATTHSISLCTVLKSMGRFGVDVKGSTKGKLEAFYGLIVLFADVARTSDAETVARKILIDTGLRAELASDASEEGQTRRENVEELLNGIHDFCESRREEGDEHTGLADYLSEVSLLVSNDDEKDGTADHVNLMTVHAAKGLEFPTVFVVGMEENIFPSQQCCVTVRGLEEERRLFYVAITRAERHCILSYAKRRMRYGTMEFGSPSRFLTDIDRRYLHYHMDQSPSTSLRNSSSVQLPWATNREETATQQRQRTFDRPSYPSQNQRPISAAPQPNFRRVTSETLPPRSSNSGAPALSGALSAGTRIEHERFGIGTVTSTDGQGEQCKITVQFVNAGTKTLLLKFARFKVIG